MIKIIISKEFFHFFKALTSKQSLIFTVKLREPWLFHFVCATQNVLSRAKLKRKKWFYVLVLPSLICAVVSSSPERSVKRENDIDPKNCVRVR